ncbi:MAG: HNH endonuclease [Gammaproteobacteria bacterium]|nr:HNH endonuclease [Gammaproteobacteria bacterium]
MSRNHRNMARREWERLRLATLRRDGYACQKCGKRGRLEVDHKVPLQAGGTDDMSNLQALCLPCHFAKTRAENGHEPPDGGEWERYMRQSRYDQRRFDL